MKQASTIFLQVIIVLIGMGALAVMLWEPHIEGRNAHAMLFEIYFKDPFLAYVYISSIPFFMGLYQAFKAFGYVRQNKAFSREAVQALRTIKYCAITIIGFAAIGEIIILLNNSDDHAGGVFIGNLIILGSGIVAAAAIVFEQVVQNGMDIKAENEQQRKAFKC